MKWPTLNRIGGAMIGKLLGGDSGALVFRGGKLVCSIGVQLQEDSVRIDPGPTDIRIILNTSQSDIETLTIGSGVWLAGLPAQPVIEEVQAHENANSRAV